MAIKHLAILALAGSVFAQMSSLESAAMSLTDISPPGGTSSASEPTDSSTGMSDSLMTTTITESSMAASMSTEMSTSASEMSGESGSGATPMPTESSMSSTDMGSDMSSMTSDMSSMTSDMASMTSETGTGTGTMAGVPVGTGGAVSNATSSGQTPVAGDAVVNGVSLGLFVVSVALTALIQL
ncbi:hypothetical protein F4781DRAFT_399660 [Annulohypoxylon bovei var. microspora]|nr:hypothetical protein F4781DRAFT_399660 [Annulohypoxylon bovei var. microspora]